MKKSIFIITLVFTLLLSCSGGGLVAYADDEVTAKYADLNDCLVEQGFPKIDIEDGYSYLFVMCRSTVTGGDFTHYYIFPFIPNDDFDAATDTEVWRQITDYGYRMQVRNLEAYSGYYLYMADSSSWEFKSDSLNSVMVSAHNTYPTVYYSDVDLYWREGTLFFQQTPLLSPKILGVEEKVLVQVITQENPLKEVLILLPMAMVCLVGYVALRKALRTLETILKTA